MGRLWRCARSSMEGKHDLPGAAGLKKGRCRRLIAPRDLVNSPAIPAGRSEPVQPVPFFNSLLPDEPAGVQRARKKKLKTDQLLDPLPSVATEVVGEQGEATAVKGRISG